MKTMTLALGGGAVVAAAVVAAVLLRPLPREGASAPVVSVEVPEVIHNPEEVAPEVAAQAEVAKDVSQVAIAPPVRTDFRFEPDGSFLVSGQAAAGLPLAVLVDEAEVERVDVGVEGAFLVLGLLGFSDNPRVMRLVSDPDGAAVAAEQTFVIAANPAPVEVAQQVDAPAEQPDQPAAPPVETTAQVDSPVAPEPAPTEIEVPASPAILSVTQDGVEIVQAPVAADTPPEVMANVALDTITYDLEGEVVLQGRAVGEGFVQLYVDNAPVSRLEVDAEGNWRGDLPDVDTGVYTLRIDEVDAEGAVISRIETPFLREDPVEVAAAMAEDVANPDFTVATRTVQPGATLWAIAEERYGAGVLYVNVFEANRDRIRDPDLIYPGQVFVLPEGSN